MAAIRGVKWQPLPYGWSKIQGLGVAQRLGISETPGIFKIPRSPGRTLRALGDN